MAVRNDGDYRVCCHANTSVSRGVLENPGEGKMNAAVQTLEDARNSGSLKDIRAEMLKGNWPTACTRCQKEESSGMQSKRLYSRHTFSPDFHEDWARSVTANDGTLDLSRAPLLDLDVRFGNKCNLACRMCGPSDSSAWIPDYEKLGKKFTKTGFTWYEGGPFWESLERNSHELQHIYVVGGEPLLIEQHYVFLQEMVDRGRAGKITLEYNTNLTVLPEKALQLWKHFGNVRLGVSMDGVFAVNDYIRYPSRFSVLEKNLTKIDIAEGNFQVWLACSVSIYNLHHLVDYMKWVHSKKFSRIGGPPGKEFFRPHPVHQPQSMNIQCLPEPEKDRYEKHLQESLSRFLQEEDLNDSERNRAQSIIAQYLKFLRAKSLHEHWPSFIETTKKLDAIRKQNFSDINPIFNLE
jgi:sulfatase maturation enzyme AslB (radical SAM superfamily)